MPLYIPHRVSADTDDRPSVKFFYAPLCLSACQNAFSRTGGGHETRLPVKWCESKCKINLIRILGGWTIFLLLTFHELPSCCFAYLLRKMKYANRRHSFFFRYCQRSCISCIRITVRKMQKKSFENLKNYLDFPVRWFEKWIYLLKKWFHINWKPTRSIYSWLIEWKDSKMLLICWWFIEMFEISNSSWTMCCFFYC